MDTNRPQQPRENSTARTPEAALIALVRLLARQAAGRAFAEALVRIAKEQNHADQED